MDKCAFTTLVAGNIVEKIAWVGMLTALVSCSNVKSIAPSSPEPSSPSSATGTIVIADISDEPAKKIEEYQPMADYLAAHLNEIGIGVGEVKIAPDMKTVAEWLASGEVDLYFDSPYPAMIVSDASGAQPILRRWKDGVAEYNTIIFARRDRGFKTLNDLQGQMVAFEENFSTSGYMLPKAYLAQTGLKLVEKESVTATTAEDEVGYVFSESDQNNIQWVLSERVAAAAVGAPDFQEIPEETRAQLTVLAETESLPRHLVVVSPTMNQTEQAAVKSVMMSMDETEAGRAVLEQFEETAQFDEFPQGSDAALTRMRELYELVENR